jgi:hypothetical protein
MAHHEDAEGDGEDAAHASALRRASLRPVAGRSGRSEPPPLANKRREAQRSPPGSHRDVHAHVDEARRPCCRACIAISLLGLFASVVVLLWVTFPHGTVRGDTRRVAAAISPARALDIQHTAVPRPGDIEEFGAIFSECRNVSDTRGGPLKYLSEVLQVNGDRDEWGNPSKFLQPVSVVRKLVRDGHIPIKSVHAPRNDSRPLYAVNFGARDGRGTGGNTDPTYPIFAELGFHGLAVEASPVFVKQLQANMRNFNVRTKQSFITVGNAVSLIQEARLPAVDVFKIDIDSFDCDITPLVLKVFKPALVIAEFNVYFPPPIKMKLIPSRGGFDSSKRSNIYECSIQFLNDDVMRPLGYVLVQQDWQNVIYLRAELAAAVGMAGGVDVQVRVAGVVGRGGRGFTSGGAEKEHACIVGE